MAGYLASVRRRSARRQGQGQGRAAGAGQGQGQPLPQQQARTARRNARKSAPKAQPARGAKGKRPELGKSEPPADAPPETRAEAATVPKLEPFEE